MTNKIDLEKNLFDEFIQVNQTEPIDYEQQERLIKERDKRECDYKLKTGLFRNYIDNQNEGTK